MCAGMVSGVAYAAEPTFLISWKAQNYTPPTFFGKSFPTYETPITASFELISNNAADKGKVFDVSNRDVRWYINNRLVARGIGLKTFTFRNPMFSGGEINMKVSVSFFDAEAPVDSREYFVSGYVKIPSVSPEVVIQSQRFNRAIPAGSTLTLHALPLFFNSSLDALSIVWDVNGQSPASIGEDPFLLRVTLPSSLPPGPIDVVGVIRDLVGKESASGSLSFNIQ